MLTPKQEKFAQCIADGMSQADAYRASFDVKPNSKPETVQESASRLRANPKVAARIATMQELLVEKALWTREDSVNALKSVVYREDADGKVSDVVAAVKELNAMHGYQAPAKIAQTDTAGNDVQPVDVNAALVAKLIDKLVD